MPQFKSISFLALSLPYGQTFTHIHNVTTTGKNPNAEKDWGQEEKRMTEDEMAG